MFTEVLPNDNTRHHCVYLELRYSRHANKRIILHETLCHFFLSEFDWVVARRQFKITLLSPDYHHLVRTNTKLHN